MEIGEIKEIKEIELLGRLETLEIVARHHFGISIISLTSKDVLRLKQEMDEWLEQQKEYDSKRKELTV